MRKPTAYACETVNASYTEFSKEAEALKQDPSMAMYGEQSSLI